MPLYSVQKNVYFKKTSARKTVIKANGHLRDFGFLNLLHYLKCYIP